MTDAQRRIYKGAIEYYKMKLRELDEEEVRFRACGENWVMRGKNLKEVLEDEIKKE